MVSAVNPAAVVVTAADVKMVIHQIFPNIFLVQKYNAQEPIIQELTMPLLLMHPPQYATIAPYLHGE